MTVSGCGREPGLLLLGLGTTIPTTVDPCGAVGKCGGAALVIWMYPITSGSRQSSSSPSSAM